MPRFLALLSKHSASGEKSGRGFLEVLRGLTNLFCISQRFQHLTYLLHGSFDLQDPNFTLIAMSEAVSHLFYSILGVGHDTVLVFARIGGVDWRLFDTLPCYTVITLIIRWAPNSRLSSYWSLSIIMFPS